MKRYISAFALLFSSFAAMPTFAADAVGIRHIDILSPERGKSLDVTIWYPADADGTPTNVGENRIFEGTPAMLDASVDGAHHPLILLSHGSGATVATMAWLANSLVSHGFIVAGPNHPGTTSGDSTPADTPKIWQRTGDISRILTALTDDPQWSGKIDADRVGVLGFSLGGTTALSLAGGRLDLDAYIHYCDRYPRMADCVWFAGGKAYINQREVKVPPFDLKSVDRQRYQQSNRDARLKVAILVDPGMATAFKPDSISKIDIPLYFINEGKAPTVPIAVKADTLAGLSPKGHIQNIDGAVHMSFLSLCKPGAAEFLKKIGETDPLCTDAGTRPRTALHDDLASAIASDFMQELKRP